MPRNVIECFKGWNLFWQGVAIALTVAIVLSGFDWQYFVMTRGDPLLPYLFPAVFLGMLVPVFLPIALILYGTAFKRARLALSGWASGQAALIGLIISSVYKAFTGRVQPPMTTSAAGLVDSSRDWMFGFLYALYVGLGVSVSIHWFSESVAGAIIGAVIGIAVGRSSYFFQTTYNPG